MKLLTETELAHYKDVINRATCQTVADMPAWTEDQKLFAAQITGILVANLIFVLGQIEAPVASRWHERN